ncbi:hypothetical protein SBC1_68640 (plasmid) [Caballeronia sp. SBC1]|uniref:hypothetical protein n=1 Tax=unclassified Caballeronia TaxID=2646786 RepID=UPI0013E1386C|nr:MULTISPECIES: hypothetical protein [unclassified Caballeronia]QIE28762.1 hypothetical protein SBC2_68380 [Caballeronia sp. SBC2]QIN66817.1 hypothetical protein SBC1_68640 [Caballeronia sp. SBC1]
MTSMHEVDTEDMHGAVGVDDQFASERIAAALAEIDTDIFVLRSVPLGGSIAPDVLAILRRMTGPPRSRRPPARYPDATLRQRSDDALSDRCGPCGTLDSHLDCDRETWRVAATYLGLASRERRAQVE